MTRTAILAVFLILAFSICVAQNSNPTSQTNPDPQAAATAPIIPVELSKSLDSKKLKTGDEVFATTGAELRGRNGDVVPRGSKVIGHVTQATARSNGNPDSTLGITFEKIVLKDGKELPIKTVLQAVSAPPNMMPSSAMDNSAPSSAGQPSTNEGRSQSGQAGGPPASNLPGQGNNQPAGSASNSARPQAGLTAQSTGVIGIHGLQMGSDGLLTSTGKSVKVDSGSRILLRVQNQ